ncbi:hypothetical protein L2E82_24854 [Cichorium intybus]|uniref:Uncharacterized protein n=1 Tax=Cichorium intybus TaxID=13427 RepID=A0ACB9E2W4_CICIN|nr:hypothetical protein L2E82_24854 [Cichorium intybus]
MTRKKTTTVKDEFNRVIAARRDCRSICASRSEKERGKRRLKKKRREDDARRPEASSGGLKAAAQAGARGVADSLP